jgi:adenosylmethionine-8-amino-7-oxononanoate aminotransferase
MNLSERDHQSIWHPFTQHATERRNIAIVRGQGALLYDDNGKEYIDAVSSWWTNLFGHANKHIADSIHQQLQTLEHVIFAGFTHEPAISVAEKLLEILPDNQSKIFFSDNGSTSVEVALKMALQYWYNSGKKKKKIIAFKDSYHGDTFGAMSVGARGSFNKPFEPLLFDVEFIELPSDENFKSVTAEFTNLVEKEDVAAFIFEPLVLGSAGMLMYEPAHLDQLISIAHAHEVICIADEVMTGFGRTGKTFASDYLNHSPDIFCLSKGITGGFMPLGATSCTQQIFDAFLGASPKTFFHGHSYTANPLACAAANASLDLLKTKGYEELAKHQKKYSEKIAHHPAVENFRQLGTIVAFDVKSTSDTSYFNEIRDRLYDEFIKREILLRPLGNTVYVMPPYVIMQEQLEKVYNVIQEVLNGL